MKYKLTDETKQWCGYILHRIQATKDFGNVKAGDLLENRYGIGFVFCDKRNTGKKIIELLRE